MPRTRRNNNALSPTQSECVNKTCIICMSKIRTGQAAIKLDNERQCYHTKCISDYHQNRRYGDLVTPHRNQFSQNDIARMNRFRRAMRSRSRSNSSRSRSESNSSRSRSNLSNRPRITAAANTHMMDMIQFLQSEAQRAYNELTTQNERDEFLARYTGDDQSALRRGLWAHAE